MPTVLTPKKAMNLNVWLGLALWFFLLQLVLGVTLTDEFQRPCP